MKALQLGINYGMGVRSLSSGLNRHPLIGSEVIIRHQRQYPTYWGWRADMVERAMLERVIVSEFDGWPLHISTSPNKRTLYNFPMQAGGAEMLRLAANRLCEAGLVPSMLVHDGILLELDNEEQVQHAIEIMRIAGDRSLRRPGDRCRHRSEADWRRALSGQASGGEAHVGGRDGRAAGDRRAAGRRRGCKRAGQDQELQVRGRQVGGAYRRGAGRTSAAKSRSSFTAEDAEIEGAVR